MLAWRDHRTSTIFISHSRRDEKLVRVMKEALDNVDHTVVLEEFIPEDRKRPIPYDEIRQNVQRSDMVFLFLTDNVVATEYTRNWVVHENGLASAYHKKLFVFERRGFRRPYPIPYVTDYMLFDDSEVEDILKIQALAKQAGAFPPAIAGAGVGAALGATLGPVGMLMGGLTGLVVGAMATQQTLRL